MDTTIVRYLTGRVILEERLSELKVVYQSYVAYMKNLPAHLKLCAYEIKTMMYNIKLQIQDLEDCIRKLS